MIKKIIVITGYKSEQFNQFKNMKQLTPYQISVIQQQKQKQRILEQHQHNKFLNMHNNPYLKNNS